MKSVSKMRVSRHLRARQLGGRERVGRYARETAWGLIVSFAHRTWPILIAALLLPTAVGFPFAFLFERGIVRWILIGVFAGSGPWLAVMIVVVMSGASDTFMGLDAEGDTATELRRLRRDGWRLANGVKIRGDEDIDHLVVGAAGVILVESKWSRHRWPLEDLGESFMSERLSEAIEQVKRSTTAAQAQFRAALADVQIHALCVVWSPVDTGQDLGWIEVGGITVVRGPSLIRWIATLEGGQIEKTRVEAIWAAVEKQASLRDADDRRREIRHRRTAFRAYLDWLLVPFASAAVAAYSLVELIRLRSAWVDVVAFVGYTAAGPVALSGRRALRPAALGWLALVLVFDAALAIAVVRHFLR
jgi:hypothetical protein